MLVEKVNYSKVSRKPNRGKLDVFIFLAFFAVLLIGYGVLYQTGFAQKHLPSIYSL
jgi:hypothetical protein